MKDFVNRLYRNHSLIYKGLLFLCTTFLIVYLFPKSGKFKYNFERGKPWQSENLQAPFDFAIKKTDAEITAEKKEITDNTPLYFNVNNLVKNDVENDFDTQFSKVFSDSIPRRISSNLHSIGKSIISELYHYGILSENYDFSDDKAIVILDGREKVSDGFFSNLVKPDAVIPIIDRVLAENNFLSFKTEFTALFFDIVVPNLSYNKSFTDKLLEDE